MNLNLWILGYFPVVAITEKKRILCYILIDRTAVYLIMKAQNSGCCGRRTNNDQQLRIPLYAIRSVELLPAQPGNRAS